MVFTFFDNSGSTSFAQIMLSPPHFYCRKLRNFVWDKSSNFFLSHFSPDISFLFFHQPLSKLTFNWLLLIIVKWLISVSKINQLWFDLKCVNFISGNCRTFVCCSIQRKTQLHEICNKLECWSLEWPFGLVQCLWVRQKPTQVKHPSGASL